MVVSANFKWCHIGVTWQGEEKLESDTDYKSVFITVKLSAKANMLLTKSSKQACRKKVQEAKIRLEDHLNRYESISKVSVANEFNKDVGS